MHTFCYSWLDCCVTRAMKTAPVVFSKKQLIKNPTVFEWNPMFCVTGLSIDDLYVML